ITSLRLLADRLLEWRCTLIRGALIDWLSRPSARKLSKFVVVPIVNSTTKVGAQGAFTLRLKSADLPQRTQHRVLDNIRCVGHRARPDWQTAMSPSVKRREVTS